MAFLTRFLFLGAVVGVLGFSLLKSWERADNQPSASPTAGVPQPQAPLTIPLQATGSVGGRQFSLTKDGDQAVAVFSPYLPRDDRAFLRAAAAVVATGFGAVLEIDGARLVGSEVVVGSADGRRYYLFPIKQDTGEVHSIRVRRE